MANISSFSERLRRMHRFEELLKRYGKDMHRYTESMTGLTHITARTSEAFRALQEAMSLLDGTEERYQYTIHAPEAPQEQPRITLKDMIELQAKFMQMDMQKQEPIQIHIPKGSYQFDGLKQFLKKDFTKPEDWVVNQTDKQQVNHEG